MSLSEQVRQALWKVDADQPMWKIRTRGISGGTKYRRSEIPDGADGDLRGRSP